jgi:hypothetical protein
VNDGAVAAAYHSNDYSHIFGVMAAARVVDVAMAMVVDRWYLDGRK